MNIMDYVTGTFSNIESWLKQPFNSTGNIFQWFAFVALIMIAIAFWVFLSREIED